MTEVSGEKPGSGDLVRRIIKTAVSITKAVQPAVQNLAKQYPKLKPLSIVVNAAQAGVTEAEKQLEEKG